MAIGVFIVDDQELLRLGVAALLEVETDIEFVGEAARAADALVRIQATRPDVVLLDTRLPDGDGVALCRAIRAEPLPAACLMLTASEDDPMLVDALDAGAAGYVLKSVHSVELVDAVRKIAAGGSLLDASGSDGLLERMRVEAAKAELLSSPVMTKLVDDVAVGLHRALVDDLGSGRSELAAWLIDQLERVRAMVASDGALRQDLDRWLKAQAAALVGRCQDRIAVFIERGVHALGPEGAVRLIEEHAGDDLQYIRVNGTVVGGLAGGAIYGIHLLLRLV